MKINIDYTLELRNQKLQPIYIGQDSDFYHALYKLNDFYIDLSKSKSNDDVYSAIVYKNKQYKDIDIIDGENVIMTNFLVTFEEVLKEIEICMLLIEKRISSFRLFNDVSVNQAKTIIFKNIF